MDDESRTRGLLRDYIPWEELGIREVETARNGLAALECAMEWHPDIILCDIRMPKLDGIEFARRYRAVDQHCHFIFLSGYTDKEYLKSAIHLKALTYLEKPINLGEVRAAVESAILLCLEERKKKDEEAQLQVEIDRSLPLLRQEMVRRLIANPASPNVKPALLSQETFLLPLGGPYTVAATNLYWEPADRHEDVSAIQERLLAAISHHPFMLALKALAGFDAVNQLVLVFPGEYGSAYRDGRETVERLMSELRLVVGSGIELRLGIGEPAATLLAIPTAYKQASEASAYQYYCNGAKPVFSNELVGHAPIEMDWEKVRSMREQLRKGDVQEAKRTIGQWTLYARSRKDLNIVRVKDTFFRFLLAIMETAVQLGLIEASEDTEWHSLWKEVDRISNLDALEACVLMNLDFFSQSTQSMDDGSAAGIGKIRDVVRYINAHFEEKGFTIRSIADQVQLSETYLCALFKKHRGQTIKEFITETRMNRAKELLLDSNSKLFEVALRLGFTDANYFTTFFKRYEGCTPSEYRERAMK